jgi:hypothetical protein
VKYQGPFFMHDPGKTFAQNAHDFVEQITTEAETQAFIFASPARKSGTLESFIHGRVESVTGKPWAYVGIVSTYGLGRDKWPGGPFNGFFNYAGKVNERVGFMQRARQSLIDARAANADLLKGIED